MKAVSFDPRGKMFLFFLSCFFTMNTKGFAPLIVFTSFIAIVLLLSGEVKSGIAMYLIFMLGTLVSYWALNQSPSLFVGVITAIFAGIRLFIPIVMAFALLFKTTKISEYMASFEKLHIPYSVVIPFAVMFRFIPTVKEEWDGIRNAMAFRGIGVGAKGLILHPLSSTEHILVPLLFSCVNIMDELVSASLARGLDSDKKRKCYFDLKMHLVDYILVVVTTIFFAIMLIS